MGPVRCQPKEVFSGDSRTLGGLVAPFVYPPIPPLSAPAPTYTSSLLSQLTQEPAGCCSQRLWFAQNQFHRVPSRILQWWGLRGAIQWHGGGWVRA